MGNFARLVGAGDPMVVSRPYSQQQEASAAARGKTAQL